VFCHQSLCRFPPAAWPQCSDLSPHRTGPMSIQRLWSRDLPNQRVQDSICLSCITQ
jgi:hypothetical protein